MRSSVNPKGNWSIQISLICMTKDGEMMSKIEELGLTTHSEIPQKMK